MSAQNGVMGLKLAFPAALVSMLGLAAAENGATLLLCPAANESGSLDGLSDWATATLVGPVAADLLAHLRRHLEVLHRKAEKLRPAKGSSKEAFLGLCWTLSDAAGETGLLLRQGLSSDFERTLGDEPDEMAEFLEAECLASASRCAHGPTCRNLTHPEFAVESLLGNLSAPARDQISLRLIQPQVCCQTRGAPNGTQACCPFWFPWSDSVHWPVILGSSLAISLVSVVAVAATLCRQAWIGRAAMGVKRSLKDGEFVLGGWNRRLSRHYLTGWATAARLAGEPEAPKPSKVALRLASGFMHKDDELDRCPIVGPVDYANYNFFDWPNGLCKTKPGQRKLNLRPFLSYARLARAGLAGIYFADEDNPAYDTIRVGAAADSEDSQGRLTFPTAAVLPSTTGSASPPPTDRPRPLPFLLALQPPSPNPPTSPEDEERASLPEPVELEVPQEAEATEKTADTTDPGESGVVPPASILPSSLKSREVGPVAPKLAQPHPLQPET